MASRPQSPTILRFGTFEVDLRADEIRKQGRRLRIQQQPFQVLEALLQRPGEVVTREELRKQIWPEDTFVDFDNSLNTAINKLREALGDSADNPRFIETLPKRGYRFVAPISANDLKEPVAIIHGRKVAVLATVVVLLVAAVIVGWLWRSKRASMLTEKDTIVVGDFANSTGDTVFDGTLREGLSVQLEQSPFLGLVSDEGIHQTLRMMAQPPNARLTPDVTREVCQRTNSRAGLEGSIALIGTRYDLILKAVNCANGDLLTSTEAQANDKSHVLGALSRAASEMRRKLGESLSTVQKYNVPLEQATTPSLEALQAYNLGWQAFFARGDNAAAASFFHRAAQLDPNFAMAYWAMAQMYGLFGEANLAAESGRKAYALRERLSELERLKIECDDSAGDNNLMKAVPSCEFGAKMYPGDSFFHEDLGMYLNSLGRYEAGLKEELEAARLAPYNAYYCGSVVYAYLLLNRVQDAEATAKEAPAKCVVYPALIQYDIAFYGGDAAEMARQVDNAAGAPGVEGLLLAMHADTAAYFGHLGKARELSRRAADSAELANEKETAEAYDAVSALREALFGNAARARQAVFANRRPKGRDPAYGTALALTYAGDTTGAQTLIDNLSEGFPEDTLLQFNYLPTLRARVSLMQGNPQQALNILRVAAPYELGLPAMGIYSWPNLYPVYVRGEAYLAAHRGNEAAAEFQKILSHRGIVFNEPIGALAHLQFGRAFALQGETAKARTAYQDFLTLWKDADPDIPILKQAKAEYAKLQ